MERSKARTLVASENIVNKERGDTGGALHCACNGHSKRFTALASSAA